MLYILVKSKISERAKIVKGVAILMYVSKVHTPTIKPKCPLVAHQTEGYFRFVDEAEALMSEASRPLSELI